MDSNRVIFRSRVEGQNFRCSGLNKRPQGGLLLPRVRITKTYMFFRRYTGLTVMPVFGERVGLPTEGTCTIQGIRKRAVLANSGNLPLNIAQVNIV